ncbi:MAG TPA: lysylphosphatidylglycerol synthase transmembrane domain-containing protein [Candidatus Tectomicrobia bacterium]|nr:lysylphosphatidylglycerol synthase transmembrane domain-containing protein [Candidatus Tectomicrobia bacterium]
MRWGRIIRWTVWLGVPAAVAFVAYRHRDSLIGAAGLVATARWPWLLAGVAAIAGVYACRALVYGVPLRLLGYTVPRTFLWETALMSTSLHQLIPVGGASGYAFLTWALHQRGVPSGEASLVALIDTLSYAIALATLVVGGAVYLLTTGVLGSRSFVTSFGPGLVLVALAALVYWVQRDRARCSRVVLGVERRIARLFGTRRADAGIRSFLNDYFRGKSIIGKRPRPFARMIAFQYAAVLCDAAALYSAFLALGMLPGPWIVLLGFVLAMAGGAVASAPGGGGSFELIMAAFFADHGLGHAQAIAAAVLYRGVGFWLPVAVTLVLLLRLRHRRRDVRKTRRRSPAGAAGR